MERRHDERTLLFMILQESTNLNQTHR